AFEVRGDAPVTVPKGFPLTAQVTGLEQQADFETADELVAYPWLSRFALLRGQSVPNLSATTLEISVETADSSLPAVTLEKGDRLLVGRLDVAQRRLSNAEIVLIESVRVLHGETFYRLKGALMQTTSATELTAYKLGRSFRHFGHNGPLKATELSGT